MTDGAPDLHDNWIHQGLGASGEMALVQELDGKKVRVTIAPGQYAINPPGVWHTADVADQAEAVFITAGEGTLHRPR
jgi:hypothetical protein